MIVTVIGQDGLTGFETIYRRRLMMVHELRSHNHAVQHAISADTSEAHVKGLGMFADDRSGFDEFINPLRCESVCICGNGTESSKSAGILEDFLARRRRSTYKAR